MKVIIAGSRDITDFHTVATAITNSNFVVTEVVSGCCRGVDKLGEQWAEMNSILVKRFPADWDRHGKKAGFLRNCDMADYADAAIVIRKDFSKGATHMIEQAMKLGLEVYVQDI